jgi:hypothetical protein
VKHAASVRPEPGSNSPSRRANNTPESAIETTSTRNKQTKTTNNTLSVTHEKQNQPNPSPKQQAKSQISPHEQKNFLCSVFKKHHTEPTSTQKGQR